MRMVCHTSLIRDCRFYMELKNVLFIFHIVNLKNIVWYTFNKSSKTMDVIRLA
ncbi:hypothetical protein HanXRQr2_Chr09g0364801 [Helianthus annuus]|uniref:Uncharacterized protein n=1 Tax=Helianthus annuus TaxID=4232 RepID=A0A9K3N769_HELAN|nr:hypothetical protein HanXRQr2_Chr09g0364801 [Helianthus annuus]